MEGEDRARSRLRLWPIDVTVEEYGDRAELVGLRALTMKTTFGTVRLPYVLYRIRGGVKVGDRDLPTVHAEFTAGSFDGCTDEQFAWLRQHKGRVKTELRQHLGDEWRRLYGSKNTP